VATGIVQEFQFGMNWSEYSRFVGDVFGAPLAMEGWSRSSSSPHSSDSGSSVGHGCPDWSTSVHLDRGVAVNMSAFFIIAANSFMQHPVGAHYPETDRAELTSIVALFITTLPCSLLTWLPGPSSPRAPSSRCVRVVAGAVRLHRRSPLYRRDHPGMPRHWCPPSDCSSLATHRAS
jgi:hypothetical protein